MADTNTSANTTETAPKQKEISTKLTRANDIFMPLIEKQLSANGINMTDYQKQCVLMAIAGMNTILDKEGLAWNAPGFDSSNVTQMLQNIAALQLNAAANPKEIYFQTRNMKVKGPDGKDIWKKQIEMGIEGDGNDSILRRFGANIKKVGQYWQVREGDKFTYPRHKGFDLMPPEWEETGRGKVVRIVYPILKDDNSVEFYIAEKDDVKKNLAAHMSQNMMNETFGIAKDRYNVTSEQKKEIDAKKKAIIAKLNEGTIDEVLDNPDLQPYISPSWTEMHSRDSMIIRKMRNNIVKKIPKDFSNAYIATTYLNTTDDMQHLIEGEIEEEANGEVIDVGEYQDIDVDPETGEVIEPDIKQGAPAPLENKSNTSDPEGEPNNNAAASNASGAGSDGQVNLFGTAAKAATAKGGSRKADPFAN